MGGKKTGENTKKASGNAKKAQVAAQKQEVEAAEAAKLQDQDWAEGAKSLNAKRAAEAEKKANAIRLKAERDALLAAEEESQPSKPKKANAKTAPRQSKGTLDLSNLDSPNSVDSNRSLDLSNLDSPNSVYSPTSPPTLNATGIDNALDALSLSTDPHTVKMDRHPERRLKAAYAAYEARRLPEIEAEYPGLRKQQRIDICRKEFKKSAENPFNQDNVVEWDATKAEVADAKVKLRSDVEKRLAE